MMGQWQPGELIGFSHVAMVLPTPALSWSQLSKQIRTEIKFKSTIEHIILISTDVDCSANGLGFTQRLHLTDQPEGAHRDPGPHSDDHLSFVAERKMSKTHHRVFKKIFQGILTLKKHFVIKYLKLVIVFTFKGGNFLKNWSSIWLPLICNVQDIFMDSDIMYLPKCQLYYSSSLSLTYIIKQKNYFYWLVLVPSATITT